MDRCGPKDHTRFANKTERMKLNHPISARHVHAALAELPPTLRGARGVRTPRSGTTRGPPLIPFIVDLPEDDSNPSLPKQIKWLT